LRPCRSKGGPLGPFALRKSVANPEATELVDVAIAQDDLAGAANLSRSSVTTMLGRLAERGLIEQDYRGVAVRAPVALRAFVDQG
jgi:CRP-like cAMP-binding protein